MSTYRLARADTAGHTRTENPCVMPMSSAYVAHCPAVSRFTSGHPQTGDRDTPLLPHRKRILAVKTLTDIAIRNLKPRSARYEVPDLGARGLRVIVFPTGRKSFAVRYRNTAGRTRKFTLPGGISLAAARKLAGDA